MRVVTTTNLVLTTTFDFARALPHPRSELGAETWYTYSQGSIQSKVCWEGLAKMQSLAAVQTSPRRPKAKVRVVTTLNLVLL